MTLKRKWWFFVLTNKTSALVPPFFLTYPEHLFKTETLTARLWVINCSSLDLKKDFSYTEEFLPFRFPDLAPPHFPQLRSNLSQKPPNISFIT